MRKKAKTIAASLAPAKSAHVDGSETLKLRTGLRHIGGCAVFPPEQPTIDALVELGLVKLADPEAAPVCGRYQLTDLGTEVLGLIGGRG